MAALDFPSGPSLNQVFPQPPDAPRWRWDGMRWKLIGAVYMMPYVSPTPPPPPVPLNALWWNSADGTMQIFYNDGDSEQWVGFSGPAGPRGFAGSPGPQGPQGGNFSDAPQTDGAYLRRNGAWIPMTHASA
ncbi:MAG: hypothetical protein C5B60_07385, partial [Chloroflexi bacterium]